MENPYTAPNTTRNDAPTPSGSKASRSRFMFVIATILGTSLLLTLWIAPKYAMAPSAAMLFFIALAIGPFSMGFHQSWIYSFPNLAIGFAVFAVTFLYLVIPNKITFATSIVGAVAWVFIGAFLILLLA